ncbi:MAG: amidohydrolase [Clostridiales bacterium]|jgi:imidazolonepropionase-like amidohydrolase|nr:amidohydrolase [Clostridiales bacterium]
MSVLLYGGKIYTMDGYTPENGYILIEGNKIIKAGDMDECPDLDCERIDLSGKIVLPGLVDAHSHVGIYEEIINADGEDENEDTDPITPHLRALDAINPKDGAFSEALSAGITTVAVGPGSANPIGGQIAALKTRGGRVDDMIISPCVAMKFALGENPKRVYNEKERSPVTRMATAAIIRETLAKASEYRGKREVDDDCDLDFKLEALLPLLNKNIPAHIHCHRADDIFTAIRIAKEFDIRYTLLHCTEGYMIADELKNDNADAIVGPFLTTRSKPELAAQSRENAARLCKAGIRTAICTDHPESPQDYLMLGAALAAREGMTDEEAFKAVTVYPAELLGLGSRIGSIAAGKDADIVVFDGHPFDTRTKISHVFIDGERVV